MRHNQSIGTISRVRPQNSFATGLLGFSPLLRLTTFWTWNVERHEALSNRVVMKGHGRQYVAADWLKLRAA